MVMPLLVDVELPSISGQEKDACHVGFAVDADDGGGLVPGEITLPVGNFFNGAQANGQRVRQYISHAVSRAASACTIRLYDLSGHLDGSPHGSPVFTDFMTLGAADVDTALPTQIAQVVTLNGFETSDQPPVETPDSADAGFEVDRPLQRHRGRMYIGPLMVTATDPDAGDLPRPTALFSETLRQAVKKLSEDLVAGNHDLCVWSRKDAALYIVKSVDTDDTFDTQRRRRLVPTARTRMEF